MLKQLFLNSPFVSRSNRRSDYPLASITHGEEAWEEKKARVERLLAHAVLRTGERSGWASGV